MRPAIDPGYTAAHQADIILSMAHDVLNEVVSCPGSFSAKSQLFLAFLRDQVPDEGTLLVVIEFFFESAISMPYCAYITARMCCYLSDQYTEHDGTKLFRQLLLQRCHSEHETRNKLICGDARQVTRLRSFALFLAELYMQLGPGGQRLTILSDALIELVKTLSSSHCDETIKCMISVLKCCGLALESSIRQMEGNRARMDDLFIEIGKLVCIPTLSFATQEAISSLILLRSNRWIPPGANRSAPLSPQTPPVRLESVQYGPDGEPLTAEEEEFIMSHYLRSLVDDDGEEYHGEGDGFGSNSMSGEEDAALYDAYEEFLRMGADKKAAAVAPVAKEDGKPTEAPQQLDLDTK
jgi:hypothetical protein